MIVLEALLSVMFCTWGITVTFINVTNHDETEIL